MKKILSLFLILLLIIPLSGMTNSELGLSMVDLEIVVYTMDQLSSYNIIYESQSTDFFFYENRIVIEFFIGTSPYDSDKIIFYREEGNVIVYLNPKMLSAFISHFQEQVIQWDVVNMVTFVNKNTKEEFFATDNISYNTYISK